MNMRRKHRSIWDKRKWKTAYLFLTPFLFGFLLFYVLPFCISIVYTFTKGVTKLTFVGIENYLSVFDSAAFQLAVRNTFRFICIAVPLIMALAMVLALLLHRPFRGASWYRSAFLYPLVVPIASGVMVFQAFFAYSGILNSLLQTLGLQTVNWLNSDWAFAVLVGLYLWKNTGYNIVLLMAGLNGIAKEYYEVADLEGANRWQRFRYVMLPLIGPTFLFTLLISVINSFKSFREAYLLSGTLPHSSIYMLQHFIHNNFENLNYQRLSVASFITFAAVLLVLALAFFIKHRQKKEDGRI